ncbi:MAG TPA: hypothetical protein VG387_04235 [Rhizomicrobium sp.]|jgi:hypothetical protein|nr:hypothetical protein [Rhizomicrobium sp.]
MTWYRPGACATFLLLLAAAMGAPAGAQTPASCQGACWKLSFSVVDAGDHAGDYRFTFTVHDQAYPLTRSGGKLVVSLPRVLDPNAGETAGVIAVAGPEGGDPLAIVQIVIPGYVRAPNTIDIPFYVQEPAEIRASVDMLDSQLKSGNYWQVYFQGLLLLPDLSDNDELGARLKQDIYRACSNLARTGNTFIFFRFDQNDCQHDAPGITDVEHDDVDMAIWYLYKYNVDPLGDGQRHTPQEYGAIDSTLGWLHLARGNMGDQIVNHRRLRGGWAPVPTDAAFTAALMRAKCLAGQSCQPF